jgi:hypothetical protein
VVKAEHRVGRGEPIIAISVSFPLRSAAEIQANCSFLIDAVASDLGEKLIVATKLARRMLY